MDDAIGRADGADEDSVRRVRVNAAIAIGETMIDRREFIGTAAGLLDGARATRAAVPGVAGVPREKTVEHIGAALRTLGEYARPRNVTVILESHGDFTDSPTLLELMHRADSPAVAILWDAHHTFVFGKESPETTVREIGK